MKKLLTICLLVCVLLLCLASCSSRQASPASTTTLVAPTSTPPTTQAPLHEHVDGDGDSVCDSCSLHLSQGLRYALSQDGTYYIVIGIGTCTDTELAIPSTYEGLPVQAIAPRAFSGEMGQAQGSFTKVVVPDSMKTIGSRAFAGCSSLISVQMGNGVDTVASEAFVSCRQLKSVQVSCRLQTIERAAFSDCATLEDLDLPDSLLEIQAGAFRGCTALTRVELGAAVHTVGLCPFMGSGITSITVDSRNINFSSIDGNLYTKDGTTLLFYAPGKTETSFALPRGTVAIGPYAFEAIEHLQTVSLPDTLLAIGEYAFFGCPSLAEITIPDSVVTLEEGAFFSCFSMERVTVGLGVTTVKPRAFEGCMALESVTFQNPNGWQCIPYGASSGTQLLAKTLSQTSTAAEYLTQTYVNYTWVRN